MLCGLSQFTCSYSLSILDGMFIVEFMCVTLDFNKGQSCFFVVLFLFPCGKYSHTLQCNSLNSLSFKIYFHLSFSVTGPGPTAYTSVYCRSPLTGCSL